jgi:hypothetical protein
MDKLQFLKEQFRFSLLNHMMDYYFDCYISPSAKLDVFAERLTDAMFNDDSIVHHLEEYLKEMMIGILKLLIPIPKLN